MLRAPISATARYGLAAHREGSTRRMPLSPGLSLSRSLLSRSLPLDPPSQPGSRRGDVSLSAGMNIDKAVVGEYEDKPLKAIAEAPVSALEGIAEKREAALAELKIKTVQQLGQWKYFKIARSIVALAATENADSSKESSEFNINKAVDKAFEAMPLNEILAAPPSALSGLTAAHDDVLRVLQIKSVKDLGMCKWMIWAEAIVIMSDFDSENS